jgi:two-component system, cell cycle response regulator
MDETDSTMATRSIRLRPGGGSGESCLVVIYGFELGLRVPLDRPSLRVGRDSASDLMLPLHDVSRHHCLVQVTEGVVSLRDLGSTNGTLLNERPIPPNEDVPLRSGDLVHVGGVILKFLEGGNVESLYHEEIYRTLMFDGLTRVPNRRFFVDFLDREMSRCRRHHRPLSLMLLDVDDFKTINDATGHLGGDLVLRELATVIGSQTRREECPARFGGDEFAIGMPETTLRGARTFAEKLRATVELHEFVVDGRRVPVTISLGVAAMTPDMGDVDGFLKAADGRLYEAKNAGRNRVAG